LEKLSERWKMPVKEFFDFGALSLKRRQGPTRVLNNIQCFEE
jgi:hypothetical protein